MAELRSDTSLKVQFLKQKKVELLLVNEGVGACSLTHCLSFPLQCLPEDCTSWGLWKGLALPPASPVPQTSHVSFLNLSFLIHQVDSSDYIRMFFSQFLWTGASERPLTFLKHSVLCFCFVFFSFLERHDIVLFCQLRKDHIHQSTRNALLISEVPFRFRQSVISVVNDRIFQLKLAEAAKGS